MGSVRRKLEKMGKLSDEIRPLCQDLYYRLSPWNITRLNSYEELMQIIEQINKLNINTSKLTERVESLNWSKPKIVKKITFDPTKQTYIDVETGLARGFNHPGEVWLVGLWHQGNIFQYKLPEDFQELISFFKDHNIKTLVAWSNYDNMAFNPILQQEQINVKWIDACSRTTHCVIWHSYNLNDLYCSLFPNKKQNKNELPGYILGIYADHLFFSKSKCKFCEKKGNIIELIREKNRKDLIQMVEVCKFLWEQMGS